MMQKQLSEFYIFQDSAPTHRVRETVNLLLRDTSNFISSALWPPNNPDLSSVDYKVCLTAWYELSASH